MRQDSQGNVAMSKCRIHGKATYLDLNLGAVVCGETRNAASRCTKDTSYQRPLTSTEMALVRSLGIVVATVNKVADDTKEARQ